MSVVERDGGLMVDRHRLHLTRGLAETERIVVRAGRVRRFAFGVRLYALTELRDLLQRCGFGDVQAWGELGAPLTLDSRRLVARAERR